MTGREAPPPQPVYPRPRGGTAHAVAVAVPDAGLSPPTRGNPLSRVAHRRLQRSIPAHAGEPRGASARGVWLRVYPRPRGGTQGLDGLKRVLPGLSPPTRGNPPSAATKALNRGSIPAHAGEPIQARSWRGREEVYPRPRGGTGGTGGGSTCGIGLSPPTRGNPRMGAGVCDTERSIPAHAGEPSRGASHWDAAGVYPRPRGGTRAPPPPPRAAPGLSPPTRGNHPPNG